MASEDEMAGWNHQCSGHELGQTLGDGEDKEAWHAAVHGVAKSRTQLSDWTTTRRHQDRLACWCVYLNLCPNHEMWMLITWKSHQSSHFFYEDFWHPALPPKLGFFGGSDGKESTCNAEDPRSGRFPWRGNLSTQVFLPGEFHGQRSLLGYSGWGCKELEMTEQLTHTHSQTHIQNWKSNVF